MIIRVQKTKREAQIRVEVIISLLLIFPTHSPNISKKIYICIQIKNISPMSEEIPIKRSARFDRLAFTVLAIEASAQKMNISPSEMRRRLDKVGLIKSLIQDCYDTLHTESREAVANDVVEALKNWEKDL